MHLFNQDPKKIPSPAAQSRQVKSTLEMIEDLKKNHPIFVNHTKELEWAKLGYDMFILDSATVVALKDWKEEQGIQNSHEMAAAFWRRL